MSEAWFCEFYNGQYTVRQGGWFSTREAAEATARSVRQTQAFIDSPSAQVHIRKAERWEHPLRSTDREGGKP